MSERDAAADLQVCEKATPGPWDKGRNIECRCKPGDRNCDHMFGTQAEIFPPMGEAGPIAIVESEEGGNAAFIALARTALPYWIAEAERQRQRCDRLRDTADSLAVEFLNLKQRAEAAEAKLASGTVHYCLTTDAVVNQRDEWKRRAEAAEARLREIEEQILAADERVENYRHCGGDYGPAGMWKTVQKWAAEITARRASNG